MNRKLLAVAIGVGLFAGVAQAADWPQFRGAKRDGVSAEKNLLKAWPKKGPRLLWQVKDVGFGYGGVAVAGERLYLVGTKGLKDEFATGLDARNGKQLWSTGLGKVGNPDQQPSYPGARTTPTLDGERLYALGSNGDLVCVAAANGKELWRKNLRSAFGGKPGVWAYAESPLVDGERVIVTPGGAQATLVALNKKTGALLWKSAVPGGDEAGYASAMVTEIGGVRQVVQFLRKGVVGVEAATGKFLWRHEKTVDNKYGVNALSPLAVGAQIYSGSEAGGGLAQVNNSGGRFAVQSVYLQRKAPFTFGGTVKVGEHLYGTTNTTLVCIDFSTGKLKWEERGVGAASVIYADGRLYVHGENGEVALVEATPVTYRELGRFTPPNPPARGTAKAWNYPAVANGRLYVRDLSALWVYDVRHTGQ